MSYLKIIFLRKYVKILRVSVVLVVANTTLRGHLLLLLLTDSNQNTEIAWVELCGVALDKDVDHRILFNVTIYGEKDLWIN